MAELPTPTIGQVRRTERVFVNLRLEGLDDWPVPYKGVRFRPTELRMEWRQGELAVCSLVGDKLTKGGIPYTTGVQEGVSFMARSEVVDGKRVYPKRLDEDTPRWIAAVVEKYAPR